MLNLFLLFITFSLSKQCNEYNQGYEIDTVDSAFECIESIETTEEENNDIITGLKYYLEAYVFKDILKNPPQPSFSNNYYEKVDIDEQLNKINTKTTSMYDFYSQIKNLIISTRDSHLAFNVDKDLNKPNSELVYFYYFLPFKIYIDNNKKMYLIPRNEVLDIPIDVPEEIVNNEKVAVKTINGEDPFNIIREFGKKYMGLKCPHAQFTLAKDYLVKGYLGFTPLSKEYLNTPISITWENGESLTINYKIIKFNRSNQKFQQALERSKRRGIRDRLKIEDFEETNKTRTKENENNEYQPNCSPENKICCLTTSNKVNTFIVNTFDVKNENEQTEFTAKLFECVNSFDSNNYPIQVIFPKNNGGLVVPLAQLVEKIISPYDDVDFIGSVRISDFTEDIMKVDYSTIMYNPETCEVREKENNPKILGEWYTKPNIIKYGGVEHKVSQPSTLNLPPLMKFIINDLYSSYNPRKPTEVVVYTDSFCYSACSWVTKGLKEWGGAIIVGFDGDPNGKDDEFEVGLSPSSNIQTVSKYDDKNPFTQYGYKFGLTVIETYRYNYEYNESIPREFLTDMIDERVNIYQFDQTEKVIKEFEEETKKIIEKYQTKCNPKNKRLVKRDEKCDKEINIEHGHGGYECGDNGEWSTKCVLAYCDDGYKFDYINNKCIEDVCVNPPTESESDNGTPNMTVNLVMIIIGIITLIL
ncbi:hypothetical protein EDI_268270 [Entamoeba dispar SAW760]|uniref:Uncharacterized protein n=1 Tax=Entamoeba dispar (strain ATCC PRA-260 / SAW760) TaxID=370354 RepID=B0EQ35_ENTDS|nr:uncharacterized protein EDI_268270 [Entamoeba dispar SAW760]EDR23362.1 hypothetical protein EDI_268270 [Entamoeba dispar SAW760]|eukprot:EDR23362.1 hypothetical protein EDI_268270 [Entamoeba dispar SAW760]